MSLIIVISAITFFASLRLMVVCADKIIAWLGAALFILSTSYLFYCLGVLVHWAQVWGSSKSLSPWVFCSIGLVISVFASLFLIKNKRK